MSTQGDLVFKLNPGPTDHQSTIHTHVTDHRAPLSSRTRNYSNLITVNRAPLTKHSNTPVYTSFTANAPTFRIPVVTPGTRLVRQHNAHNNNNLRPLTQSNGNAIQDHHSIALDFCLLNAQSLNNKAGEFTAFVCEYKPDLSLLQKHTVPLRNKHPSHTQLIRVYTHTRICIRVYSYTHTHIRSSLLFIAKIFFV